MAERKKRGIAGDKTICLPVEEGLDYEKLVKDREAYRTYLEGQIKTYPELFPEGIEEGYRFHGIVNSKKQGITTRRIYIPTEKQAYQIRPDSVTPYMSESSEEAAKAMYLRKHGVSYEGIAYVLGRSEMHWYRLCQAMGRVSLVGTTLKQAQASPPI